MYHPDRPTARPARLAWRSAAGLRPRRSSDTTRWRRPTARHLPPAARSMPSTRRPARRGRAVAHAGLRRGRVVTTSTLARVQREPVEGARRGRATRASPTRRCSSKFVGRHPEPAADRRRGHHLRHGRQRRGAPGRVLQRPTASPPVCSRPCAATTRSRASSGPATWNVTSRSSTTTSTTSSGPVSTPTIRRSRSTRCGRRPALKEAGVTSHAAGAQDDSWFVESWINGAGATVVNKDNGREGWPTRRPSTTR